jgi:hypothetical protein
MAAGCAMPGKVTVDPSAGTDEQPKQSSVSFSVISDKEMDLALVYGDRELFLGLDKSTTLQLFAPLDKSIEFSSLPPQFDEKNFSAFGWEQNGFAFGGITFNFRDLESMRDEVKVVFAMYTRDDVADDVVQTIVQGYKLRYKEPIRELPGSRVAYWFWEKPGRRLMVNTSVSPTGKKSVTVAVGGTQVMTLLGMSPDRAAADKSLAIQRLNAQSEN